MDIHNTVNYKIVIDSLIEDSRTHKVTISGWAVDFYRKKSVNIRADEDDILIRRRNNVNVTTLFGLEPSARASFDIVVPDDKRHFRVFFKINGMEKPQDFDIAKIKQQLKIDAFKGRISRIAHYLLHAWTPTGFKDLVAAVKRRFTKRQKAYDQWIKVHEVAEPSEAEREINNFTNHPLISVVVPVYNVDDQWLRKCIDSLRSQWYSNWELCLADDHSTDPSVKILLEELARSDSRIKVTYRKENGGIAKATNSAIALAQGQYIGFMDNDDELAPQALYEIVAAINSNPAIDFLYSDEDKITEKGIRFDPFFKPDFSPHLLLSHNYITHFVVVSKALLDGVGNLDPNFDGSQDYDFVLRATEKAKQIHHIPRILYHWRTIYSSVAGDPLSKMYAYTAGQRAIEAALSRRGIEGTVSMLKNLGTYKIDYTYDDPSVTVIASGYSDQEFHRLVDTTQYSRLAFVRCEPGKQTQAASGLSTDMLVFLQSKYPAKSTWLKEMVNYMQDGSVGAVGGKIWDNRKRVSNVGITLRALKTGHPFEMRGQWDVGVGYNFRDMLPRDMFAVTEDCLITRRSDFMNLSGFDLSLPPGLRGIDYCVRLLSQENLTTLWQPYSLFTEEAQPLTIARVDLQSYLRSHPGLKDPFAVAYFPNQKQEHSSTIGTVDKVVLSPDGSSIIVTGWAADLEQHGPARVELSKSSYASLEDVHRVVRSDVNMSLALPIDAKVGFKVRISITGSLSQVRSEQPSLVLSGELGRVDIPLKIPASTFAFAVTDAFSKVALLRHPRRLWRQVSDRYLVPRHQAIAYRKLITRTEKYDEVEVQSAIRKFARKPLISVLIPVYNVELKWLETCLRSIQDQYYPNWEICLADDCSTKPGIADLLKRYQAEDKRIKVVFRKQNGHISRATNSALELASGEFVALLDNDDELPPQALFEVVKALNEHPDTDMVYTDEDKKDENGKRFDPHFKPDYSPDLLLSTNYISHLGVYRTSIVKKIGGFRPGYEGSQDYDMVLRFIEQTQPSRIQHVAKVLYHWRALSTSTASSGSAKDYASEAGLKALQSAMERREIKADVVSAGPKGIYNVHYEIEDPSLVSVIIPTKDGYDNLERCMNSLIKKTTYDDYEVIVVDNGSKNPAMKDLYTRYKELLRDRFSVLDIDIPFNFARLNNIAAQSAKGRYLLFLNDDTEVISPSWMSRMVSFAQLDRVGVVGAKLYYPVNTIQHAGIVLGLGGVAGHIQAGVPRSHLGYFGRLVENVNYYAVTAACCMVKTTDFMAVSGFDEEFVVAYNDVDLCVRVHDQLGRDNVWSHEAELYHYESMTRGLDIKDKEKKARLNSESNLFLSRYSKIVANDPYYNPNLSRTSGNFWIREE